MLWFVIIIFLVLLVFTGGGILGWILTAFQSVFSLLAIGFANLIGCFIRLFFIILFLIVVFGLLFS